ncbi:hypothetical protein BKA58DRAFT_117616 [Alternaria rosae]|uniref:uncharacterized protein n=1 Tax=Alternaria rosae TaxID=1187941 RepID=UPI001E8D535D|nr:uncharacterized protein BKA58DRAFT_117616 [Alternaria rosae]KAH6875218.1 hypothetical protein BKA58DRAFT_117616 [Alternaria rosae]
MCGAEPLVSMNSAESVDAFYALLAERKHLAASRSVEAAPKWPAARNDHYCHQEVCRHDVIDLSSICEPSDSDGDGHSHIVLDDEFYDSEYETPSRSKQYEIESCRSGYSDEFVPLRYNTPPTFYDAQEPGSRQMSPIDPKASIRALRQELDILQISSAKSCLDLEERFDNLSLLYGTLRRDYEDFAHKHDVLLRISLKQCEDLDNQAKVLMELGEWKMRTQNSFAEVQVQGQEPEVLYLGTPRSTSTVSIGLENLRATPLATENQDVTSTSNRREKGVGRMPPPPITPATTPERCATHARLVLRL